MKRRADWLRARRHRRALERRLPEGLRRELRVIRLDDIGQDEAQVLLDHVRDAAGARALRRAEANGEPAWSYVLPAIEHDVLRRLDRNRTFHSGVRARVRQRLRLEHLLKVQPDAFIMLPETLNETPRVRNGELHVRSSIGLGTASVLEAEPEELDAWMIEQICQALLGDEEDVCPQLDDLKARVLVVGALAGGFARALTTKFGPRSNIQVTESDWVFSKATNLPRVARLPFHELAPAFDAAVVVMPSPSMSNATNQRDIYRTRPTEGEPESTRKTWKLDPARLGPRRWTQVVSDYLAGVSALMKNGARVFVLLPSGIRTARGYIEAPDLLDPVFARLGECGFQVRDRVNVVEIGPVAQPFVAKARPSKAMLVLQKKAENT